MSRTVTVLFDSRADAEAARARLASQVEVQSSRILAKDTAAAVDDLKLEPNQSKSYRAALLRGDHLLIAQVPRGEKPNLIVELLSGKPPTPSAPAAEPLQSFKVGPDEEAITEDEPEDVIVEEEASAPEVAVPVAIAPVAAAPVAALAPSPAVAPDVAEPRSGLRIGEPQTARGGARVRSLTREEPAERQVSLNEERVELENRSAERRLSADEITAGGLLKDRIFEVVEMREEPVITKEFVVREEVIVRKTQRERTETVRDTVRRTQVEVEELPSS